MLFATRCNSARHWKQHKMLFATCCSSARHETQHKMLFAAWCSTARPGKQHKMLFAAWCSTARHGKQHKMLFATCCNTARHGEQREVLFAATLHDTGNSMKCCLRVAALHDTLMSCTHIIPLPEDTGGFQTSPVGTFGNPQRCGWVFRQSTRFVCGVDLENLPLAHGEKIFLPKSLFRLVWRDLSRRT